MTKAAVSATETTGGVARKLMFGGPALPKDGKSETWYMHKNEGDPPGVYGGQVFVKAGDVVDYDRVENAESYIERGIATLITE